MSTMTSEREAFEKWADENRFGLSFRESMFAAWEARAHLAPPAQAVDVGAKWHAPGLGEVHSEDHEYMIWCSHANESEDEPDEIADDELAKKVCEALNATRALFGEKAARVDDGELCRFFADGPEGHFYTTTSDAANDLISAAGFDRVEWSVTDLSSPAPDKE